MSESDRYAETWISVGEIRCAVERVDVPAKFGVVIFAVAFFGRDGMRWKIL